MPLTIVTPAVANPRAERRAGLATVRRAPPRADDGDRIRRGQPQESVELAGDVKHRRRVGQLAEPARVPRIAAAQQAEAGCVRGLAVPVQIEAGELARELRSAAAAHRRDQPFLVQGEQLADPGAHRLEVTREPADQPRPAQARLA